MTVSLQSQTKLGLRFRDSSDYHAGQLGRMLYLIQRHKNHRRLNANVVEKAGHLIHPWLNLRAIAGVSKVANVRSFNSWDWIYLSCLSVCMSVCLFVHVNKYLRYHVANYLRSPKRL